MVLAVRPDGAGAALGDHIGEPLRQQREGVVGRLAQRTPPGVRNQHPPGQEPLLLRVAPVRRLLPEELLVPDGGPAHRESDRVRRLRPAEEFRRVLVERHIGQRVLPAGLPVEHEPEVVGEAAALAGQHQPPFAGDLRDPLPLVAARLHVGLDRGGAPRSQAFDVRFRVRVTADVVLPGAVAVVHRVAGAEHPGPRHLARLHQFRGGEDILRPLRVVQRGGHPVGEIDRRLPVPPGQDAGVVPVVVGVHVDEAGDEGLPGDIHHPVLRLRRALADAGDPAVHDPDAAFGHRARLAQRDQPAAFEDQRTRRPGARQPEVHRVVLRLAAGVRVVHRDPGAAAQVERPVRGPPREHPAVRGHFPDRERGAAALDVRRVAPRARPGQRGQIDIVALGEGHEAAVRGGRRLVGVGEGEVHPPVRAVRADRDQLRDFLAPAVPFAGGLLREEEAALRAEGGGHDLPPGHQRAAAVVGAERPGEELRFAAGGGEPREVVVEVLRPGAPPLGRPAAARHHDPGTVRRPHRVEVLAGSPADPGGGAARRRNRQQVSLGVRPGDIGDRPAVGRERRREFVGLAAAGDQPLRRSPRQGHPVEPARGVEDRRAAVRGERRPAEHPRPERPGGDVQPRPRLLGDAAFHRGGERHFLDSAGGGVHPDDPPAPGGVEVAGVGGPGVAGQHPVGLHPLGGVGLDRVGEQPLGAGLQVAQEERGAGAEAVPLPGDRAARDPARERQVAAVRGGLRRDGAAARPLVLLLRLPGGHLPDFAGLQVEPPDLHRASHRIPLARRGEVEVEAPAVRRRRRPARPREVAADQFHAAPALGVEEVEARTPGAGEGGAPRHDAPAVGQPRRGRDPGLAVLVHRARVGSVRVHQPEVRLAAAVGDEGDRRPVRREPGVRVDRRPAVPGEALGAAALRRESVEVAEQVEDEGGAVRGDIHREEGALGGLELEIPGVAPRQRGVPPGVVGAPGSLAEGGPGGEGRGDREPGGGRERGGGRGGRDRAAARASPERIRDVPHGAVPPPGRPPAQGGGNARPGGRPNGPSRNGRP